MIKRHFLIIVLLAFVGLQAFAEQIDEQQAVKIAVAFMNQKVEKNPSFRRGIKMKDGEMTVSHVIRSLKGEADIYILNARKKGNGFVIVAGDTHTGDAVLGYSDTGEFDYANAPENAKAWVDGYAKAVESLRLQGNAGKRKMPKAYASDIIDPLLTTQWNQGSPYNDLCPNSYFTGCVATAMAQIMKYWNWPEQGQGSHTNFYEPSQTVDFSQSHYDWDAMLNNYNGVSDISDGSKTAVAKLMYDCGCSVDMFYDDRGSSSSIFEASKALFWYFKYRKSTEVFRDGYEGDWEELLLNELREQRPILYSGGNGSEGHAFVCDGYAGDGCFHFNYGWDGNYDGNYRLDGELLYDQSQSVIVGICPDYEMTTTIVNDCLYQKIDENNARLEVYYAKSKETAIIPESVEIDGKNYAVTEIAEWAFRKCTGLTSITIGNSVATIEEYAFWGCTGLKSITIPNSVKTIGDCAFAWCSGVTELAIPNSVTSMGDDVFSYCPIEKLVWDSDVSPRKVTPDFSASLKEVILGPNMTTIGDRAFESCYGLTSITIPNSVTTIGEQAFFDCPSLTGVIIGNSVTSIGGQAFWGCSGLTSITIPNSVTNLGAQAFWDCSGLTSITIPNSVTSIGEYTFYGCTGLTSAIIGNSVTTIGECAFLGCSSLASLTIPNSVTTIEGWAFNGCHIEKLVWDSDISPFVIIESFRASLKEVVIGPNVTSIGEKSFEYCRGLTNLKISNSVTTIGENAFYSCSGLTELTIPNSVTSIGKWAFSHCSSLASLTISNSMTTIGEYAFQWCSGLTSITIPNSVTTIGSGAFSDCSGLTSIKIPNSVTTIGLGAFSDCSGLTSITIPNSVTSIGDYALYGCSSLTSLTIPNSVTTIGEGAFFGCQLKEVYVSWDTPVETRGIMYDYSTLYVPIGTTALYRATYPWSMFNEIKEYDPSAAIENVKMDAPQGEKTYYNLNGQRVNNPTNGIYIIGGKKIYVK